MTVYNEIEPYAAQWIRNLVAAGHVADGIVDERSIADLKPADLVDHRQAHFFAGIGGWSLALRLAGWPDDLKVWTGSCPCQPFSTAGKRRGFDDDRHLWPVWFGLIRECRPPIVFGEQVAGPAGRMWLDAVSADLESAGYAVGAANLCAAGVGAPHIRQRIYFVAVADADRERFDGERVRLFGRGPLEAGTQAAGRGEVDAWSDAEWIACADGKSRPAQPGAFPLAYGVPVGVVGVRAPRAKVLRGYGNAIVAQVAAEWIGSVMDVLVDGVVPSLDGAPHSHTPHR